ncbi:hypothetical protein [Bifidobacterium crudilactis]|jgi:hypothetical protein|uniref:hypothetical protein n=1 Tax=Bifidobacterium crudilactis TaxID=327277 RepID=UPI002352152E|nr:hypothetical protein [Bifidobacterium crudilactis]MCI1217196.1 hypothetical protein [Bifidobacterium crudilactis]MDN5972649.1 hypothetical protein [Bifidobacterium crudilactis]MDN6001545.1 hypothetical protein [Bifidobacterium crudilactis]MDN6209943.1 hypothetical protein [Bifidobacterium crudilactis]MDN6234494.1 hypothetical protein [Bifidobacterium crudilactis]
MAAANRQDILQYLAQHDIHVNADTPMVWAEKDTRGLGAALGAFAQLAGSRYFVAVFTPERLILVRMTLGGKINVEEPFIVFDSATTKVTMKKMFLNMQYLTVLRTEDGHRMKLLASNAKGVEKREFNRSSAVKEMLGLQDRQ